MKIILSIIIILFWVLINWLLGKIRKRTNYKVLCYGDPEIENSVELIKKHNFYQAETILEKLNDDELTAALDAIALFINSKTFDLWEKNHKNKDLFLLAKGVFFLHKAWIIRSHALASKVSEKKGMSFLNYLDKAEECFSYVDEKTVFYAELNSRMIRLIMSMDGYTPVIQDFFKNAVSKNPNFFYPYILLTEAVQPKWDGSEELINEFIENLPNHFLIKNTVKLKFILDAYVMSTNYFDKDLKAYATEVLQNIEKEFTENNINSINKYMFFNYLEKVCELFDYPNLAKKYNSSGKKYHTLYLDGVIL